MRSAVVTALLLAISVGCSLAFRTGKTENEDAVLAGAQDGLLDDTIVNLDAFNGETDDDDDLPVLDADTLMEELGGAGTARRWGCKGSKCRRKCNAKGKNGACVGPVCVCWR
ncbi:hypothetical protein ONE63_001054 [Megalurothrips usitatus]|uniref:Uncharacterized protein n=1 Tax=Megalurothrips usitatus TaxID=439358 RepID=A0AAV7XEM5_9NEOP|nr:hypothetical protein ONE63_001054 [Megalurothrips usitatus]